MNAPELPSRPGESVRRAIIGLARKLLRAVCWLLLVVGTLWAIGAVRYLSWLPDWFALCLASGLALGAVAWTVIVRFRLSRVAPLAAGIPLVWLATLTIQPSTERQWSENQQRMPAITIADGVITIENFRHTEYRSETDLDPRYRTVTFPLSEIHRVWFIVQRFTAGNALAHTFISFELASAAPDSPQFIAVSAEIRSEQGESYSPVEGLYRRYELMYVIGAEQDLIGVRTNVRRDDRVWLYPVNGTPEQAQALFLQVITRAEKLRLQPEFYHTLFNNCTNNIVVHTWPLMGNRIRATDWRIVLPGYSARVAWEHGLIGAAGESFASVQSRSRIDQIARAAGLTPQFSHAIRQPIEEPDGR